MEADPSASGGEPQYTFTGWHDFAGTSEELKDRRVEISANLQLTGASDVYEPQTAHFFVSEFSDKGEFQPLTTGKACTCFAKCKEGYSAAGASCLKKCPVNFEARASNTCYGSYDMNFDNPNRGDMYLAWDMDVCEQEWGKGKGEHLPELLGTVATKCEEGFFRERGATFGICLPDCKWHGLKKSAFGNATCVRPSHDRESTALKPGQNSCPTDYERSNIQCPHIAVHFKLLRLN